MRKLCPLPSLDRYYNLLVKRISQFAQLTYRPNIRPLHRQASCGTHKVAISGHRQTNCAAFRFALCNSSLYSPFIYFPPLILPPSALLAKSDIARQTVLLLDSPYATHPYTLLLSIFLLLYFLHLHSLPNITWVSERRRIRWAGYVARMGQRRGSYRVLVGKDAKFE